MPKKMTQKEFVVKAKKIHPKYDFSKVLYINSQIKVEIVCPIHGSFFIRANGLLNGKGCAQCAGNVKLDTKSFVEKAKKIFPEYDYSKVIYITNRVKVKVECPIHGEFEILPTDILNKHGCKECGYNKSSLKKTKTNYKFLNEAKKIFPNYDYSLVKYTGKSKKVDIICQLHGIFRITPNNLLSGHGCTFCGNERKGSWIRSSTDEFLIKAKKNFPYYDYSSTIYELKNKKVSIICKKHGVFEITPNSLLSGHGCKLCSVEKLRSNFALTHNDFLLRANQIHPEYDYTKSIYINRRTKIIVICKKHGEFRITPDSLFRGSGCALCNNSLGELIIRNWLITHEVEFVSQKKFKDLMFKKQLSYDFYIPNNRMLIEFNGDQHNVFVPRFHKEGLISLRNQFERDYLKKQYAIKNKYELLIIPFENLKEIDLILTKALLLNRKEK